jgi:hypothetical protein
MIVNPLVLFALTILLVRNMWCLAVNTTTIEGWEIERHETLLNRARHTGGYLDGPDGLKVRIKPQEFPYDIGIWANIKQGMGTGNVRETSRRPLLYTESVDRFLRGSGPWPLRPQPIVACLSRRMVWKVITTSTGVMKAISRS